MVTYLSDDFNRANNASSPGSPAIGGPYTAVVGTWGITSNHLYVSTSLTGQILTCPGAADIDFGVDIAVLPGTNDAGLLFRYSDANNYWEYYCDSGKPVLRKKVAGTLVNVWVAPVAAIVAGDKIRVVAKGSKIYCFIKGTTLAFVTDDTFNQAATVIGFRNTNAIAAELDNALAVTPPADPTGVDMHAALFQALDDTGVSGYTPLAGFPYKGRDTAALDAAEEA